MRTLFLRELSRLAPVAAACFALGAIVMLAGVMQLRLSLAIATDWAALAVLVAAPLLLGVASFAPDAESGASQFLALLPLSRSRVLATRLAAVVLLLAATTLACVFTRDLLCSGPVAVAGVGRLDVTQERSPLLLGLLLGAGLVASVAVPRTLLALVTAPLFVSVPAGLYVLFAWSLSAPPRFYTSVLPFLVPALLVAAAVAHARGDVHRASRRPLALASGTLALAVLLGSGYTGVSWALARRAAPTHVYVSTTPISGDGRRLVVSRGEHLEAHGWQFDRMGACEIIDLDRGGEPVAAVPNAWGAIAFSPRADDFAVVVSRDERSLGLRREVGGRVELRPFPADDGDPSATREDLGWLSVDLQTRPHFLPPRGYVRRHGVVLFARPHDLEAWDGTTVPLPAGSRSLRVAAGEHALVEDDAGTPSLWCVHGAEPPTRAPFAALPAGFDVKRAALSKSGDVLVVLGRSGGKWELHVLDVHAPERRHASVSLETDAVPAATVDAAPDGSRAFVEASYPGLATEHLDRASILDLEACTSRELPELRCRNVTCWSPSSRRFYVYGAGIVDATTGAATPIPQSFRASGFLASGFLDERHVLGIDPTSGALLVFDAETRTVTPHAEWLAARRAR